MGLLEGKTALVFGLANKYSIAWGITEAFHREGASLAISYGLDRLESRVRPLAEQVGAQVVELADVRQDDQVDAVFDKVVQTHGGIDILIHSIAYARKEDLEGRLVETDREGFLKAMDVSVYSLISLAKRAEAIMRPGGTILTMTYYGSQVVMPNYNVMGVAKAALESAVRYLAADLGPKNIRVNAISAGPLKTLASSGIKDMNKLIGAFERVIPLRGQEGLSPEDVGNTALWLCSDWGRNVTGQVIFVDSGYNILGVTVPVDDILASREEEVDAAEG